MQILFKVAQFWMPFNNSGRLQPYICLQGIDLRTKRGVTQAVERKLKRRNAVELVIGHLRSDGQLARNFLKDVEGTR